MSPGVYFLFVAFSSLISGQEIVQSYLPGGAVIKGRLIGLDDESYAVYKNISYAEPISQMRFQPAIMKTFLGEVDASGDSGPRCPQTPSNPSAVDISEDCLHLDIYAPQRSQGSSLRPVMVWIHGGGFFIGSTKDYDPDGILQNLVSRGVIVVTINYRLGPLGFLVQPKIGITGNLGLLDQILALQWVQTNIEAFGGDPQQVTIFGESAGGMSCSFLSLSPLAHGLFSQAILMSGAAWPSLLTQFGNMEPISNNFIEKLQCNEAVDVMGCLQAVDLANLTRAANEMMFIREILWPTFNDGNVLPGSVEELSKGRPSIPTIVGTTKDETALFDLMPMPGENQTIVDSAKGMLSKIDQFVTKDFYGLSAERVREMLKEEYVTKFLSADPRNAEDGSHWYQQSVDMASSSSFHVGAYKEAVALQQKGAPVFLYSFDYFSPDFSTFQTRHNLDWKGSIHGSDLMYLFGASDALMEDPIFMQMKSILRSAVVTPADLKIRELFGIFWSNFAKTGNPSQDGEITWSEFDPEKSNYLSLNWPNLEMKSGFHREDVQFWEKLEKSRNARGFFKFISKLLNVFKKVLKN